MPYLAFSKNYSSDGVGTVTQEEKEKFTEIKERLRVQLEYQLTNFRFCFPFGRPEGALKSTLSLLERVSVSFSLELKSQILNCLGFDERYINSSPPK
jgi:hypothetical protein